MRKTRIMRKAESKPLGRPKDSGSRQQTAPNQVVHTGSPRIDRKLTRDTTAETPDADKIS